jgi:hypothetical protein
MGGNSRRFVLYSVRELDEEGGGERFGSDIRGGDWDDRLEVQDLSLLGGKFASSFGKLENSDVIETISPIILNKWDARPWNSETKIEALLNAGGSRILFRSLSADQMEAFYFFYKSALKEGKYI